MNLQILPSRYPVRSKSSSKSEGQFLLGTVIQEVYGKTAVLLEEFRIPDSRLSLDFYMPHHKIAFEFQGRQHKEFVKHFHGDASGLRRQIERDNIKKTWCEMNEIRLVEVFETINANELRELICKKED